MTVLGRLLLRDPLTLPGSGPLWQEVYRTVHRHDGRRVVVRDQAGMILFDSGDCYGIADARNRLECWAAEKFPPHLGEKLPPQLAFMPVEPARPDATDIAECANCGDRVTQYTGGYYEQGLTLCVPCAADGAAEGPRRRGKAAEVDRLPAELAALWTDHGDNGGA